VPLPPETYVQGLEDLCNFISIGNRSLLVKGKSGTGKLTLCFELAKSHSEKFDIIFISRNASERTLYNRFPWTKTFIKDKTFLNSNHIPVKILELILPKFLWKYHI
jgi:KaiC/GvpD/RAD55 family RecA-like ATPase